MRTHDVLTRYAGNGIVCSADHLASSAGIAMLRAGGSAVDAAVATNAVLAVTSPHLCGMGGDLFALVHEPDSGAAPATLNASGRAGAGADAATLRAEGHTVLPLVDDIRTVTTPGCVDGWLALHGRFGRLPLAEVLAPALGYARDGFPVAPLLAAALPRVAGVPGSGDFFPGGGAADTGQRVRRPGVARVLAAIIQQGRRGFYLGEFGEGLIRLGDGLFTEADLARDNADWVEPLVTRVWGHDLWTPPANSQGYLALLGAAIADGLPLPDDPESAGAAHVLVEVARAAAYDRPAVLHAEADLRQVLETESVRRRRRMVGPRRAGRLGVPAAPGGTTFVCAVDRYRMGVSLIQSNAAGFGSRLFEPTTGINLQNRGLGFNLQPGHPAELAPGRRPPHTLSPLVVTTPEGSLRAVLGTRSGDSQPQVLLQLLARVLYFGQRPGVAMAAPRWEVAARHPNGFNTWSDPDDTVLHLEPEAAAALVDGLRDLGHEVRVPGDRFGHAQLIEVGPEGVLVGAADPRAVTGGAAAY